MIKYPVFVIEGADGVGKTTLSNCLIEKSGAKYRHLTYRWGKKMNLYHQAAMEMCLRDAEHSPVVLDRWWPTERIYANVFRGGTKWPMWGRMLDRVALRYGFVYIFCVPSDRKRYLNNYEVLKRTREEMFDNMTHVYDGFVDLYGKMCHRDDVLKYDMYSDDTEKFCDMVLGSTVAQRSSFELHNSFNERWFAGNVINPSLLLVAEETNSKTRRDTWPFVEHGNSSLWVTKELDTMEVNEEEVMWINVYDHSKSTMSKFGPLWERAGKPPIISLGSRATTQLRSWKLPINHTIKHPQYYRRFDPGNDEISIIREVLEQ